MADVKSTMDLVREAHARPMLDEFTKSFTQAGGSRSDSTGLIAYDLEAPAKKIVPVITPLRNMCPRVKSNAGDTATRWKAITAINTSNHFPGVIEGGRGPVISDAVTNYTASYVGVGLENTVTFEADYASESFDDVKARAVENLLYSGILREEDMLLGGNGSVALGTTPTPTVANSGTGGTIGAATYNVGCVALTMEGYRRTTLGTSTTGGVPTQLSYTAPDGTSIVVNGGAAQRSSTAGTTTSGSTSSITATVTAVKGAVAYAWYAGTAGNEQIVAITTINSVLLTSLPANGTYRPWSAAPTSDYSLQDTSNSATAISYDGFFYTTAKTSGAYWSTLATGTAGTGTVLTADGKGGVVQINDALGWFWDNLQLQPDAIWANRAQVNDITTKCVGSATSPFRFNVTGGSAQGSLVGGGKVTEYQSPVDSSIIPINVHPKMPAGTIMFTTQKLPYALNNVGDVFRVKCRREWYQIEWPLRTRKYEYGIYLDSVFQHYFPVSMGVITNIAAG